MPWYLARIGAPAAAALLALLYLRQQPIGTLIPDPVSRVAGDGETRGCARSTGAFPLLGLPMMVAAVRLIDGPTESAAKLMLFGLADVAAYHLIHFGVVVRSYPHRAHGLWVATFLFALSWDSRRAPDRTRPFRGVTAASVTWRVRHRIGNRAAFARNPILAGWGTPRRRHALAPHLPDLWLRRLAPCVEPVQCIRPTDADDVVIDNLGLE